MVVANRFMFKQEFASVFHMMGIPPSLEVNRELLEKNYLERQQQFHPDRFIKASATEQSSATQQTANVNRAYKILKDPVTRAEALLALQPGFEVKEDEGQAPAGLLMRVIELREALEDAETTGALETLNDEVAVLHKETWASLTQTCQDKDWDSVQQQLIALHYWAKLLQEVTAKLACVRQG